MDLVIGVAFFVVYLLMVIFKGTLEYITNISGGLKYLTEDISFRKIKFSPFNSPCPN